MHFPFKWMLNMVAVALPSWLLLAGAPCVRAENDSVPVRKLSLAEALSLAATDSLDVLYANERVNQSKGQINSRRSGLLPKIDGQVSQSRQQHGLAAAGLSEDTTFEGQLVSPYGVPYAVTLTSTPSEVIGPYNTFDARAVLRAPLIDLQAMNEYRSSTAAGRAVFLESKATQEKVMADAATLYFEVLFYQQAVEALEKKVVLYESRVKLKQDRQSSGVVIDLDVKKEQVALSVVKNEWLSSKKDLAVAQRNLKNLLGLEPDEKIELTDELAFQPVEHGEVGETVDATMTKRPEYLAQKARESMARHEKKAAKAGWAPSLNLNGHYGQQGEEFDDTVDIWYVGLVLNIPIWDSLERYGNYQQKASAYAQACNRTENMERAIENEIRDMQETLDLAANAIAVAEESVRVTRDSLTYQQGKEKVGDATPLDVVQAEVDLADVEFKRLEKIYEYNLASVNWYKALGDIAQICGNIQSSHSP